MSLLEVGGLVLMASVLGGTVVQLWYRWTRGLVWLLDGAAAIGIFLMIIGGVRALIEWWPR